MQFKVLIVDDSLSMRKVLIKTLKMCKLGKLEIYEAENGKVALDILKNNWIDIVFTDLNMPTMTGFEMLESMSNDDLMHEIPTIIISSEVRENILSNAEFSNVKGIVKKPFYPEEVCLTLRNALQLEEEYESNDDAEEFDF